MKIIYDSELPAAERCTVDLGEGPKPCGCFEIKVEVTDVERGAASMAHKIERWGAQKSRDDIHKSVASAIAERQGREA